MFVGDEEVGGENQHFLALRGNTLLRVSPVSQGFEYQDKYRNMFERNSTLETSSATQISAWIQRVKTEVNTHTHTLTHTFTHLNTGGKHTHTHTLTHTPNTHHPSTETTLSVKNLIFKYVYIYVVFLHIYKHLGSSLLFVTLPLN